MIDFGPKALEKLDKELVGDPAWRFYRTFATPNQRAIIESTERYVHIEKPNQVGGTLTMLVDAVLYIRGIHPTRRRPKEAMQLLMIVPRKAQMGSVFGKRLFRSSTIDVTSPAFAHLLEKEPGLKDIERKPLLCSEQEAHLEKTQSSMGRVISKASIPCKYGGNDEIYFFISGDEKAWESIAGQQFHAIWRDEAFGAGMNLMPELRTRVLKHHDKPDRPYCGTIRWGCLAAKATEELRDFIKLCKSGAPHHRQIVLGPEDNPSISQKTRADAAVGMSAVEAKKRLWGEANAFDENLVFRVSRDLVLTKSPYEPRPEDNLWLAYDPGWRDPCGIGLFVVPKSMPRSAILLEFRSWQFGSTGEHVASIADMLAGRLAVTCVCDPAIKRMSPSGVSNYHQFVEACRTAGIRFNTDPCLGYNRYENTIPQTQSYLLGEQGRNLFFNVDGPGVEEALCQFETFRFKDGAERKHLENCIYQKNNTAVDLTRYFLSRVPGWIDIGPHTSAAQAAEARVAAEEEDPALARHRAWLEESARLCDQFDEETGRMPPGLSIASIRLN